MPKTIFNYILFVLLGLFWSASFLGIKISLDTVPPIFSAFLRVAVAQIFVTIIFLSLRKSLFLPLSLAWRPWLTGLFSQGIPFLLLFVGEKTITPSLASIINSTVSAWALILGIIFLRDFSHLKPNKILGLLLGIAGMLLVFWPMLTDPTQHSSLLGALSVVGMAIAYGIGGLLNQHLAGKNHISFHASLWHLQWSSFCFLLICSLLLEHIPSAHTMFSTWKVTGAILYLGVFSTGIAWIIFTHLINEWGAVRTTSIMYVVPALAICWDYLFLHITPASNEIIGAFVIIIGVMLIQWTRQKPLNPTKNG